MTLYDRLIRFSKNDLDGTRKLLGQAQKIVTEYENELTDLIKQNAHEMALAAENPIYTGNLSAIMLKQKNDQRILEQRIADSRRKVVEIEGQLQESYRTHKTYELAKETVDTREKGVQNRREQAQLDEMGLQKHRRS